VPTSNLHIGLSAWTPNTAYAVGARVSNNGIAYQATVAGTSLNRGFGAYGSAGYGQGAYGGFTAGVGPIGSAPSISDGTVTWQYLSRIDFTTLASWAASIPATLTEPVVGLLWNDSQITTTAGTALLTLSGHTTSATNTITLQPAPGEGFRDTLANQTTPFAYNAANGVAFLLPSGVGNTSYVNIADNNVIIQGLQFQDPFATSGSSIIGGTGSVVLEDCILDGYAQAASRAIVQGSGWLRNCLVVDRQSAGGTGTAISLANAGAAVINGTLVSLNGNTAGFAIGTGATTTTVRNTALFGYTTLATGPLATFDHCVVSTASIVGGTAGAANLFGCAAANQFVSPTADFRLIAGADCIESGIVDYANLPAGDDISGDHRPYGISWDIGSWEYRGTGSIPLALWADPPSLGLALAADPTLQLMTDGALNRAANAAVGFAALAVVGLAGQSDPAAAAASILPLSVRTGIAGQSVLVSAQSTLAPTVVAQLGQQALASARISFMPFQSASAAAPFNLVSSAARIPALSATGGTSQQNPSATLALLPPITGSAGSTIITGAAGQITLFALSAAVVVANPLRASAAVTLPPIRSASFLSKLTGTDTLATIVPMFAAGQMSSMAFATGRTTLPPLTPTATATVQRFAGGLATFLVMRAASTGVAITQASALNTILDWRVITQFAGIAVAQARIDLTAAGQALQTNNASGRAIIDGVLPGTVPQQVLQADAAVPLTLLADGTSLQLRADIPQLNAFQSTTAASTAAIPTLTARPSPAVQELRPSALSTILVLTPIATAALRTSAVGVSRIPAITATSLMFQQAMLARSTIDLRVAATAGQTIQAAASANSDFQVVAAFGNAVLATAGVSLPMTSLGTAQQRVLAGATVPFAAITCTAAASRQLATSVTATLPALRAAASSNPQVLASGAALLPLSCAATAYTALVAAERTIVFEFATRARATFNQNASASATLPPLTAQSQAIASRVAAGLATLPALSAAGTALYSSVATAAATLPPLQAQGTVTRQNPASAAITLPLTVQAQAVNYSNRVAATATIKLVFVSGTANQFKPITAVGTLYLSFGPSAKIYTSPPGYVSGDAVVYWSD